MKLKKLDALLVPRADMYSGEEVPEDEERLKYITNFSGSAGYAIIIANSDVKSVLFSDGRYELQLKKEVDPKYFEALRQYGLLQQHLQNQDQNQLETLGF